VDSALSAQAPGFQGGAGVSAKICTNKVEFSNKSGRGEYIWGSVLENRGKWGGEINLGLDDRE